MEEAQNGGRGNGTEAPCTASGSCPLLWPPPLLLISSSGVLQTQDGPPQSTFGLAESFFWEVLPPNHHMSLSSLASRSWLNTLSVKFSSISVLPHSMSCYLSLSETILFIFCDKPRSPLPPLKISKLLRVGIFLCSTHSCICRIYWVHIMGVQ